MKNAKILVLTFGAWLIAFATQAQDQIQWMKFEDAIAENAKSPKMIFVSIYTDWCGWCKKMDKETFTDPKVAEYINDKFYAVKLNAEDTVRSFEFMGRTYNEAQMAAAMRVNSYPNFVVIEPKLQNIAQMPGYRPAPEFLTSLEELLLKAFKAKP